jgi:hypothetical protein
MAALRFPLEWPPFVLKRFSDLQEAYQKVRDVLRSIEDLRTRLTETINDHADRLTPLTGSGAPGSTPSDTGLHYLDTAAGDMYISVGTSSSSDWKKITP